MIGRRLPQYGVLAFANAGGVGTQRPGPTGGVYGSLACFDPSVAAHVKIASAIDTPKVEDRCITSGLSENDPPRADSKESIAALSARFAVGKNFRLISAIAAFRD